MDSCAAVVEGKGCILTNHVLNGESYTSAGRRVAQPIVVPSGLMRFAKLTQPQWETRDVRIVSTGGAAPPDHRIMRTNAGIRMMTMRVRKMRRKMRRSTHRRKLRRHRLRRIRQLSGRLGRAPEFTLTVSAMERAFCRPHPPPCIRRGTRLLMGRRRRGPAALLLLSPILHRWGLVHTLHALRGAYVRHGTRYVRHARRHRIRTRTPKDVRFVTRCSWKELVCNGGMACPGEDPSRVPTADLKGILLEDSAAG